MVLAEGSTEKRGLHQRLASDISELRVEKILKSVGGKKGLVDMIARTNWMKEVTSSEYLRTREKKLQSLKPTT